jgi:hypothetical protein
MKSKLYVAKYSTGCYDDFHVVSVFVSEDKELVERWVEKFNTKLTYWKEYFNQFSIYPNTDINILDKSFYSTVSRTRFFHIMECNGAFIDKVEYRENQKVTRVEIISKKNGREQVVRAEDIELSFQDDNRTLKIFYGYADNDKKNI